MHCFEKMDRAEKFTTYLNKKQKYVLYCGRRKEQKKYFQVWTVTKISDLTFSGKYNNIKNFISTRYRYSRTSSLLYRVFIICSLCTTISSTKLKN